MRRPTDKLIAGIDLHGNNLVIGVIDQDGKRIAHRKLDCELEQVLEFFKPMKTRLHFQLPRSASRCKHKLDIPEVKDES